MKKSSNWSTCLAGLLLSSVTVMVHAADFPGENWSQATPREAGLDEARLIEARDYALTGGGSGCIIRHCSAETRSRIVSTRSIRSTRSDSAARSSRPAKPTAESSATVTSITSARIVVS